MVYFNFPITASFSWKLEIWKYIVLNSLFKSEQIFILSTHFVNRSTVWPSGKERTRQVNSIATDKTNTAFTPNLSCLGSGVDYSRFIGNDSAEE